MPLLIGVYVDVHILNTLTLVILIIYQYRHTKLMPVYFKINDNDCTNIMILTIFIILLYMAGAEALKQIP